MQDRAFIDNMMTGTGRKGRRVGLIIKVHKMVAIPEQCTVRSATHLETEHPGPGHHHRALVDLEAPGDRLHSSRLVTVVRASGKPLRKRMSCRITS